MPTIENHPSLWLKQFLKPSENQHKYDRGVAVIFGAPKMTGATRLAATACARIGAGMVKVVAPKGTGDIYSTSLPAHIVVVDYADSKDVLNDPRVRAVLMGPGCTPGRDVQTGLWQDALSKGHINGVVLDAGGFSDFVAQNTKQSAKAILTPHDGEFQNAFPALITGEKIQKAQDVVKTVGGVMVLKGPQTVIAVQGDADVIVQNRPVPSLASAGTGDVLAGMIAGLVAQGMPLKSACAAAVWIHAECGAILGTGLVASDIPDVIPTVLPHLIG